MLPLVAPCWQDLMSRGCDMGELQVPFALVAVGYAIAAAGFLFGIFVLKTGRVPLPAMRRAPEAIPSRLMGLEVVAASALMAVDTYALDLVSHHNSPPFPVQFASFVGTPLVLGGLAAVQIWARYRNHHPRASAPAP